MTDLQLRTWRITGIVVGVATVAGGILGAAWFLGALDAQVERNTRDIALLDARIVEIGRLVAGKADQK